MFPITVFVSSLLRPLPIEMPFIVTSPDVVAPETKN